MWNAIERFSTQGIQFVLTILIARVLSPQDYGLVAMLGIFMAIAQSLVDSGLGTALIQKKERTETDYNTALYFNIVIAIGVYAVFYMVAPFIADFYNQPELVKITRVLGINILINSLSVVQMARLTIMLDFKHLAFVSLFSVVGGGSVGLWMAYHGYGVWTLVGQALVGSSCWVGMLWILAHWKPRLSFSKKSFHQLFSFGFKVMLSSMLHTIYVNVYSLVVGKYFNATTLGYFNRAYTLGQFPVQNFALVIQKVLYPIQCRYQNDKEKFNSIFSQYIRLSAFFLFPLMLGFAVLAHPLVSLILTDKWLPAVPLLHIVCLAQMWDPIMKANVSVLTAAGRSDCQLYAEVIKKIFAFAILFVSLPFGIRAVCWGLVLYAVVDMVIIIAFSRKITGYGYRWQIRQLLPVILLSLSMGGLVWIVSCCLETPISRLCVGVLSGVSYYVTMAWIFGFPELRLLLSFLRKRNMDERSGV